jgi:hypothetical protein
VAEPDRPTQIRHSMAYIRRELNDDMQQVVKSARTLADWHYYLRNYPWACVGVAAVLGYLVVPRKLEIHSPDEKTIEKLAKKHRLVIDEPKPKSKTGPVAAAFSFVAALALKQATTLLGQQVAMIFEQQRTKNRRDPGRTSGQPGRTSGAPGAPGNAPTGTEGYGRPG